MATVKTIVHEINKGLIDNELIYSTASCITVGIATILSILDIEFGIESGYMVPLHAFTAEFCRKSRNTRIKQGISLAKVVEAVRNWGRFIREINY